MAAAAHLRDVRREVRVFGEPLEFWRTQTPIGMFLKSPYPGSNIGDPGAKLSLKNYERDSRQPITTPTPVEQFLDYGQWFQQHAVPDLDPRDVRSVSRSDDGFLVEVDGDAFLAERVVVATGIGKFAYRPPHFAALAPDTVSHTLDHHDLSVFAGQRVAVIGGGQSAIESAALIHESGAHVDVLVRDQNVHWLSANSNLPGKKLLKPLAYSPFGVGPAFLSLLNARPGVAARIPDGLRDRLDRRSMRPAPAAWLRPRLEHISIRTGIEVVEASHTHDSVQLRLNDGARHNVDHVLLGTGYRVDLEKYSFLSPAIIRAIACTGGYPKLSRTFETTLPGLHVIGAPAAFTFGPLMRFVAGTAFAGASIAQSSRSPRFPRDLLRRDRNR